MLDSQTRALLDELSAGPAMERSAAVWRVAFDALFAAKGLQPANLVDTEDLKIPGPDGQMRIRLYRPRDDVGGAHGGLVYYHGGGMVTSSIATYEHQCQWLCAKSGCIIVSVEYRLAPEHKHPAGVNDAYAAACWVSDNAAALGIDPQRLAVGGDSAGGYLTAVVTQRARDSDGPPFAFQLLIYPAVGTRGYSWSMERFKTGYLFERDDLAWLYEQYCTDLDQTRHPDVCPILAKDFSGLPATFMITAGHDVLRADCEDYARLLREAGVRVEIHCYETTIHPFLCLAGAIDAGREALDECGAKLRHALAAMPVA